MATKLINNNLKSQWKSLILIMIFFVIAGNWISSRYWATHLQAYNKQKQIFEEDFYYRNLSEISYSLYAKILTQAGMTQSDLIDELIQVRDYDHEYMADVLFDSNVDSIEEYINDELQSLLDSYGQNHQHNFQNLHFVAFHHESKEMITSGDSELEGLLADNRTMTEFPSYLYQHVLVISYDEQGRLSTEDPSSMSDWYYEDTTRLGDSVVFDWRPIKNMTFVFAIPDNFYYGPFNYEDEISTFQATQHQHTFTSLIRRDIIIVTLIISILSILFPLSTLKSIKGISKLLDWPPEIMIVLLIVIVSSILGAMPYVALAFNNQGLVTPWASSLGRFYFRFYRRFFSIGIWVILFIGVFIVLSYFKNFIINKRKVNFRKLLEEIDFKEGFTFNLLIFMGINFLVLNILGFVWGVPYTFIIFLWIRNYLARSQSHYLRILEVSNPITHQNFDSLIAADEDLGLFNPLKDHLNQLQINFKTLLDENHQHQQVIEVSTVEFQEGMSLILKYVELLQTESLDTSLQQTYLLKLKQHTNHLKLRMEELMELSQLKMRAYQLNLESLNLVNSLQNVILSVQEQLGDTGVLLRTQFPEILDEVFLDWKCMEYVFENLITNMMTYGLPGTRGYITVEEVGDEVQVVFRNIAAQEINKSVAELLNQAKPSLSGLTLMKHYVELHGGTLELVLDGDLFKVTIKLKKLVRRANFNEAKN